MAILNNIQQLALSAPQSLSQFGLNTPASLAQALQAVPQTGAQPYVTPYGTAADPTAPDTGQAPAAATPEHHGIINRILNAITPDPGSLTWAVLSHGLLGAKQAQEDYAQGKAANVLKAQLTNAQIAKDNAEAAKAAKDPGYQIAGNNVVVPGADGAAPTFITPPPQPTETMRLVDKWHEAKAAGDTQTAALIERAIKGAQYSPDVINAQAAARTSTGVTVAQARAAATAANRAPAKPKAAAKPPAGFILD